MHWFNCHTKKFPVLCYFLPNCNRSKFCLYLAGFELTNMQKRLEKEKYLISWRPAFISNSLIHLLITSLWKLKSSNIVKHKDTSANILNEFVNNKDPTWSWEHTDTSWCKTPLSAVVKNKTVHHARAKGIIYTWCDIDLFRAPNLIAKSSLSIYIIDFLRLEKPHFETFVEISKYSSAEQ